MFPGNVVPAINHHLDHFVGTSPDAWLFGTASGSVLSARNLQRAWKKARDVAGVPHLRLHDLRYLGCGLTKETMRRGGHSTPRAALIFQHAADNRDEEISKALAEMSKQTDKSSNPSTDTDEKDALRS